MKIPHVLACIVCCSTTLVAAQSGDSTAYAITSMAALPGKLQAVSYYAALWLYKVYIPL
jgi:hypothetical protein